MVIDIIFSWYDNDNILIMLRSSYKDIFFFVLKNGCYI